MPDHLIKKIWLVGAGHMAVDYSKVLKALGVNFEVIGRGVESAKEFYEKTGLEVRQGGLENWLGRLEIPQQAIVAVGVEQLAEVAGKLLEKGVKKMLLEKPGGLTAEEIGILADRAKERKAKIFIAYNRRFYASTIKAQQIIEEDGGVVSFAFEFTEWSHEIEKLDKPKEVKAAWFLANSSHVVDLAFFLGGAPKKMTSYTAGSLSWHPAASVFAGAGESEKNALFTYHADWEAPGRWGVEIMTRKHKLIFRPMEQLQIQNKGSIAINNAELDKHLEVELKPGLYLEVKAFLNDEKLRLCSINEQRDRIKYYCQMANYEKGANNEEMPDL
jgi:predicted dehydrogenase